MKILAYSLGIALLLLASSPLSAQQAAFEWDDMFCRFKGTYDPAKVTLRQLEDARKLIDLGTGLPLETEHSAWDPQNIERLDLEALDNEYTERKKRFESLELPAGNYFQELRNRQIAVLDRYYYLARMELRAHLQPGAIEKESEPECFEEWGMPLNRGGEVLLTAWKELLQRQMKNNAAPARLEQQFNQRYYSAARDKWAFIEVIKFGWWNCVNDTIPYVDNDGTQEEEFRKLFESVTEIECDEP